MILGLLYVNILCLSIKYPRPGQKIKYPRLLLMVWICAGNGRREIQAVCRCLQITLQCAFLSLGFSAGSDLHGS